MKKNNLKIKIDFKKKTFYFLNFLKANTWVFTLFSFFFLLGGSVFVWHETFYAPKPSLGVVQEVESSRKNFQLLKSSTEGAIEVLKEKNRLYQVGPDLTGQRELFVTIDEEFSFEGFSFDDQEVDQKADFSDVKDLEIKEGDLILSPTVVQ